MNRTRALLGLIFCCFLLTACSLYHPRAEEAMVVQKTIPISSFSRLSVEGPIHLTLIFGASDNYVKIEGMKYAADHLRIQHQKDQLIITPSWLTSMQKYPLDVEIYSQASELKVLTLKKLLSVCFAADQRVTIDAIDIDDVANSSFNGLFDIGSLFIRGEGRLNAAGHIDLKAVVDAGQGATTLSGVHGDQMTIQQAGSGSLSVRGYAGVEKIQQEGNGSMEIYWVNGETTTVYLKGAGSIVLAGKTNTLIANLFDQARLDTKFLRVQDVYVRTHESAVAHVNTNNRLFAYAVDQSQINYYMPSSEAYQNTAGNGVVLSVRKNQQGGS
ncbi:MAG: hypothetical protein A2103_05110 [Gammaproteobacteria bacterium GWF2_41_13]|nr:MAG: hypothetical protein A2103_05110 [Gammaproteobacteria bacterium GWF2_41_13]